MSASQHVADLVDDLVHGLLGPAEAARVQQHCGGCASCARALEQARRRLGLLQAVPPAEPSADLVPGTMRRVEEAEARLLKGRRRFAWASLGGLAAAAVLLLGCHIYYANLTPPHQDVVVLGQNNLFAGSNASLRVRVVDRKTSRNLPNVPVKVALGAPGRDRVTLAEAVTDDNGTASPRFVVPDWAVVSAELTVTAEPDGRTETVSRPVTLKRSWKVMLSSDKPVYQPGQTIQLRALALRKPDLKPVASEKAVFTLADPKGNVLFKHTRPTSRFGITSASCELASEIQEGAYVVACQVGDTSSRMTVDIKRYVLPKFKLEVRPDRPYYAPGQTGKLTVQADYFFGKPVVKGRVEVKVTKPAAGGAKEVETLKGETDDTGKAELKFTVPKELLGTEKDGGDAALGFAATVTDSAEQKQERSATRLVTTQPVRITVIPETGRLVRGLPNVVYLLVNRADGSPVAGATALVQGADAVGGPTDENGTTSFTVTPQQDRVSWTIAVSTRDGEVLARRHDEVFCGGGAGDYLVRTDRAAYRSGQSMTLTVVGGGVEPVFVDLIKDGQTLASETVEVKAGKGEHTFDLPADLFGTVEMVAYRFGGSGLAARRRRVIYISPPDALKINATLDRPEYRPGRTANLNLWLTDNAGRPTPGAISLAGVDEAVFGVLAQRPGMEQTFYTLEEELLKPVYAIYPWAPGEEKAARRDQALFAATSQLEGWQTGEDAPPLRRRSGPVLPPDDGSALESRVSSLHTLVASSLPQRQQEVAELRHRRLGKVFLGWGMFVFAALALGYASLWVYLPTPQVLLLHAVGGIAGLVLLMLFGLGFVFLEANSAKYMASQKETSSDMPPAGLEGRFDRGGMDKTKMADPDITRGLPSEKSPPDDKTDSRNPPEKGGSPAPRVRQYFPETLLWKPELITDDNGRLAPLPIDLADSITTWRLTASAVSADGRLGAAQLPMKVFQPFFVDLNLPVSLTRGDEVGMPVVVYNYLDRPQSVKLTLADGKWFTLTGKAEQVIELAPGEVRSTRYTIKVNAVGVHKLRVTALAGEVGDAIEREIEVVPDGRRVEFAHSGSLDKPVRHTLNVPAGAIEGSVRAYVKLYPSSFSQLVEGLDNIFRMPYGCFEQTSSTTYPNVLALEYLGRTGQKSPKVEAKARQYIHLGYQRLVTFEVSGGGFDWYGRPPANQTLTAYGLMEFSDMAKVHDVDPKLIDRTREWLLARRKPDGGWDDDQRFRHAETDDAKGARLAATAYIAWAVFAEGKAAGQARKTLNYLLAHPAKQITSAYTLALVCNALAAIDPRGKDTAEYVAELLRRRKQSEDGKLAWWEPGQNERMLFYGGGDPAKIETTALAALALLACEQGTNARPSLAWLVTRKDPNGTWYSTQATVMSLKALVTAAGKPAGDGERTVVVKVGKQSQTLTIPADQAEVMKQVDLTRWLAAGDNELSLSETTKTAAGYQIVFRYHVPEAKAEKPREPLAIDIAYDRDEVSVGESVKATASVTNRMQSAAPMVMLDLPVPPGFAPATEDFAAMVKQGKIARFQVQGRRVLVYLRSLEPGKPLVLNYALRATMPVKATAGAARVYEYYDPQKQGTAAARRFVVKAKE